MSDNENVGFILTLIVLAIPFIAMYQFGRKKSPMNLIIVFLLYIFCASPMVYDAIDNAKNHTEDVHIGMGIGSILTRFYTACAYVVFIVFLFFKLRKKSR